LTSVSAGPAAAAAGAAAGADVAAGAGAVVGLAGAGTVVGLAAVGAAVGEGGAAGAHATSTDPAAPSANTRNSWRRVIATRPTAESVIASPPTLNWWPAPGKAPARMAVT
jgi:hypothetical protein